MKINSDVGESYGPWTLGNDEALFPFLNQANIACGFHASDPATMATTVKLAVKHQLLIGAHPGYDDKVGFGRRAIPHSLDEIKALITYQVGALQAFCLLENTTVAYIKPHGALYNLMMEDHEVFEAIASTSAGLGLPLMALATEEYRDYQQLADKHQCALIYEAFVDRHYADNGRLLPRQHAEALLISDIELKSRIDDLKQGFITSHSGKRLNFPIHSLCVHGDTPKAIEMVRQVSHWLKSDQ
ncbi:5-oxoprolinase subunit PxpA [Thaumasiovibrio subtropicus]|uniref:5-oxoprolinase subunit PxpA n=1 Tax=Thaumasiovibrio subtropicus TaxID=1891207 RepID=UPI000B34FB31|nr:5-oxoprolinase subunit PxpA [Thaumasiovibrio subtropicus]